MTLSHDLLIIFMLDNTQALYGVILPPQFPTGTCDLSGQENWKDDSVVGLPMDTPSNSCLDISFAFCHCVCFSSCSKALHEVDVSFLFWNLEGTTNQGSIYNPSSIYSRWVATLSMTILASLCVLYIPLSYIMNLVYSHSFWLSTLLSFLTQVSNNFIRIIIPGSVNNIPWLHFSLSSNQGGQ